MYEKLLIGKVLRPQGIKGEVKMEVYTDDLMGLKRFKTVFLGESLQKITISSWRISGNDVFATFENMCDRNIAETLRNKNIYIDKESLPILDEGVFYICDVIGCEVYDDGDNLIGVVEDIINGGGADVYVLNSETGKVLFPYLARVVKSEDITNKKIVVYRNKLDEVAVYED